MAGPDAALPLRVPPLLLDLRALLGQIRPRRLFLALALLRRLLLVRPPPLGHLLAERLGVRAHPQCLAQPDPARQHLTRHLLQRAACLLAPGQLLQGLTQRPGTPSDRPARLSCEPMPADTRSERLARGWTLVWWNVMGLALVLTFVLAASGITGVTDDALSPTARALGLTGTLAALIGGTLAGLAYPPRSRRRMLTAYALLVLAIALLVGMRLA